MEKLLNKVKTLDLESNLSSSNPSADMICSGLSHLTVLYECLEDVLINTNSNHSMNLTDELLDMSIMFLDICRNTADVISQTKQQLRDLGCDLRRNRGCSTESIITKYIDFRSKLKKEIKGSMSSLKRVENMIRAGCPFMVDSENYHMIRVFREVTSFSSLIFRLLLEFLAIPPLRRSRRTRRWRTVLSIFQSNGKVVPEDNKADARVNELQRLDAALSCKKHEFTQAVVPKELEALEATLEGINTHLHLVSRRMIATRASILNMISFY